MNPEPPKPVPGDLPDLDPRTLGLVVSMVAVSVGGWASFVESLLPETSDEDEPAGEGSAALPPLSPEVPREVREILRQVAEELAFQRRTLAEVSRELLSPGSSARTTAPEDGEASEEARDV